MNEKFFFFNLLNKRIVVKDKYSIFKKYYK